MASFEFYNDYERIAYSLQPMLYEEIGNRMNFELEAFARRIGRLPRVLDVGAAGVIPYDPSLCECTTILDLFGQPAQLKLKEKVTWRVGNILDEAPAEIGKWDFIVMSSVLHHLADKGNHAVENVSAAARTAARLLARGGSVVIFESVCSPLLASLQDALYPIYSRLLTSVLKFTYVRMLSQAEIDECFRATGFVVEELPFRQPEYIAQMRWRVPSRFYPLAVRCLRARLR